jgi:hypothetical protein
MAAGGGGGGYANMNGSAGASGGGAGGSASATSGGANNSVYGFSGGNQPGYGDPKPGGGGGGSAEAGQAAPASGTGGKGGIGKFLDISGTFQYYGCGGGGSAYGCAPLSPGAAGCNTSGAGPANTKGGDAVGGYGGGGGGSCEGGSPYTPGFGGSGVVYVRYLTCWANWSCSAYDACNSSNILPCTAVTDANSCNQTFSGQLNSYDGNCTFNPPPAWVQYPPNISANKSQTVAIQLNLTSTNLTYTINDSVAASLSQGGLLTANTSSAGFWNLKANVSNQYGSVIGLFWLNVSCFPAWSCSIFSECSNLSFHTCLAVADANLCGANYTGNLSAFDGACTYTPPSSTTTSTTGDFKDLKTIQGEIFFFTLLLFWVAMLVISLVFRNFATASLMWLSGVVIGVFLYQFGALTAIGFLLLDTAVFLGIGKLRG